MSVKVEQDIIEAAIHARDCALAQFSKFCVGAALEAEDGQIYTGCNIESAAYELTMCAERVTIWKALSEGARKFTRIAVEMSPAQGILRVLGYEKPSLGALPEPVTLPREILDRGAGQHRDAALKHDVAHP